VEPLKKLINKGTVEAIGAQNDRRWAQMDNGATADWAVCPMGE
jgi:hypothetical protein